MPYTPRLPLLAVSLQVAGVFLCIFTGIGILTAVVNTPVYEPNLDATTFIRLKQSHPVKEVDDTWTLLAGGDVMLSRFVAAILARESVYYPYDDIRGIVRGADVAIANLENPVGHGAKIPPSGLTFRAEPEALTGLKDAGFDVLSLGNNHMSDNGQQNYGTTIDFLQGAGFLFSGAGENEAEARTPAFMKIGHQTIAFLSYGDPRFVNQVHFATEDDAGIAKATAKMMKEDTEKARKSADIVVLSLHAGTEYRDTPDKNHQALLDAAAAAKPDLVLGHHPHVIQPLQKKDTTWVIDSLGNLVFDQMWSEETRKGVMMLFRFNKNNIREIEAIPIQIHNNAQPRIAEGTVRSAALKRLRHPLEEATVLHWNNGSDIPAISSRAMPLQEGMLPGFQLEKTLSDNLHSNRRAETYHLHNGRLTIGEDTFPLWQSPANWWVQDVHIADIHGDRKKDIVLSVWKNEETYRATVRNYVMVMEFVNGQLQSTWESAALDHPHCETLAADVDGDGMDELMTLDGTYTNDATCRATTVTLWQQNAYGLIPVWQSEEGRYWNVRSEKTGSGMQVVVNGGVK